MLVADDSPAFRRVARQVIERSPGFELVGTAATSEEAVELTRKLRPQLVLMDVRMPTSGGLDAALTLAVDCGARIVLISGGEREDTPGISATDLPYMAKTSFSPGALRASGSSSRRMIAEPRYGSAAGVEARRPRLDPVRLAVAWLVSGAGVLAAAAVLPGVSVPGFWGALLVAALVAIMNAILPPIIAALRLPFMLGLGFIIVLLVDAWMLKTASRIAPDELTVDSYGWALAAALIAAAVSILLNIVFGADDDDTYTLRVIQRIARRSGERVVTDVPGIIYLEIDGLGLPVLRRAMRDGNAPRMAAAR